MTCKIIICLTAFQLFVSCSNIFYVKRKNVSSEYKDEINYLGKRRTSKIKLIDSKEINTGKIKVVYDSLIYTSEEVNHSKSIPLTQIEEISFNDHFVGFVYGVVGGFGIGILFGYSQVDRSTEMAALGILGYGIGGLIVGSISGAIIGVDRRYRFLEN